MINKSKGFGIYLLNITYIHIIYTYIIYTHIPYSTKPENDPTNIFSDRPSEKPQ